jgi:hypothetical protein
MPSKTHTTLGTRIPVELAGQIREAATREGVTVSLWLARRARNNLRRTGRLSESRPQELVGEKSA